MLAPSVSGGEASREWLGNPANLAKAEAQRRFVRIVARFERAIPEARSHVDGKDSHAVALRILDQLRGLVETHRLRVEQRAGERFRMMLLEP